MSSALPFPFAGMSATTIGGISGNGICLINFTLKLLVNQEYEGKGIDLHDYSTSLRCHHFLFLYLVDNLIYVLTFFDLAFFQQQNRAKDMASKVI